MFGFPGQLPPPKPTNGGSSSNIPSGTIYEAKYKILTRKCLQVKEETDRIYNNLLHSKKLLKRLLHERRLLAERLERYGDQFCEMELPQFSDEDFAYEVLISQKKTVQDFNSPPTPNSQASNPVSRRGSSANLMQQTPPGTLLDSAEVLSSAKGRKKSSGTPRARKDPEAPRKPVNAYFIFCEQRRADVQRQMVEERQGAEVDRKEVTRKLSQLWLDLPQEEKKTFYTLYEIEKTRYDAEMKEYSASRQPNISTSSSTMLTGLPPPFPEEDAVSNEQPSVKRAKKSPRSGPGRPSSQQHSTSGIPTPTMPSNGCSPAPSSTNDNSNMCLTSDALLVSTSSEPNVVTEEAVSDLHQSAEDVFLLDNNGEAMDCLELSLPSGDGLMLSATGDDTSRELEPEHRRTDAKQTGIILDSSPHSSDWHRLGADDVATESGEAVFRPLHSSEAESTGDDKLPEPVLDLKEEANDGHEKAENVLADVVYEDAQQGCQDEVKQEPEVEQHARAQEEVATINVADIPLPSEPPSSTFCISRLADESSVTRAPPPPPPTC